MSLNLNHTDLLAKIGTIIIKSLSTFGEFAQLFFRTAKSVFAKTIFWKNTLAQMESIGVKSLPIVIIISAFTGAVFSLQIAKIFATFGLTTQLGQGLALAFSRELGPVLTSVIVAGRVGSSIAAEIGSMKVTEQIDALETLSTDPIDYLVAPRILAGGFMLPVLVIFADFIGIFCGFAVAAILANIPAKNFIDGILTYVNLWDFIGGTVKAFFFGLVITGVGTYKGLRTANGAVGVGRSTTQAVVTATIIIFILNYFLSMILYSL